MSACECERLEQEYKAVEDGATIFYIKRESTEPLVSYWATCFECTSRLCVFEHDDEDGRKRAESVMESVEGAGWWYVDGAWLCPRCG